MVGAGKLSYRLTTSQLSHTQSINLPILEVVGCCASEGRNSIAMDSWRGPGPGQTAVTVERVSMEIAGGVERE